MVLLGIGLLAVAAAITFHAVASPANDHRALIKALKEFSMSADARTQAIVASIQALPAAFGSEQATIKSLQDQLAAANTPIDDNATAVEQAVAAITPPPAPPTA